VNKKFGQLVVTRQPFLRFNFKKREDSKYFFTYTMALWEKARSDFLALLKEFCSISNTKTADKFILPKHGSHLGGIPNLQCEAVELEEEGWEEIARREKILFHLRNDCMPTLRKAYDEMRPALQARSQESLTTLFLLHERIVNDIKLSTPNEVLRTYYAILLVNGNYEAS
jgi:hypothetical protein